MMEEASGEAGGARDEVGGAMDEGQEASEETLHLIRDGHGGRGQHTIDSPNPARALPDAYSLEMKTIWLRILSELKLTLAQKINQALVKKL